MTCFARLVTAVPPKHSKESRDQYKARALRWRAWAADPTPDTWYATEDEWKEWRAWASSVIGLQNLIDMPGYNPVTQQGRGDWGLRCVDDGTVRFDGRLLPQCVDHGAMNAVNSDRTLWRCLMCGRGAYYDRAQAAVA